MTSARHKWTLEEVVDSVGPGAILRNYVEQRDVRACLLAAAVHGPIRRAADVGCGYGRLTPVLSEVASEVWGLERESDSSQKPNFYRLNRWSVCPCQTTAWISP